MIMNGLRSVAKDRAELTRSVVLIRDEVTESVIDDLMFSDELDKLVVTESADDDDDIDLIDAFKDEIDDIDEHELIDALDDDDSYHDTEIDRIMELDPDKSITADDFLLSGDDDDEDISDEELDEML